MQPPPGVHADDARAPAGRHRAGRRPAGPDGPFNSHLSLGYVPIAGQIVYALDPEWIVLDDSWAATERPTSSSRDGRRSASGREIPFHVTSLDWQESDRVLAGIMTAFGAPTGAMPIGGRGEFDGVMLRVVLEAAHRGDVHRRPHARLGRRLGHADRATS